MRRPGVEAKVQILELWVRYNALAEFAADVIELFNNPDRGAVSR